MAEEIFTLDNVQVERCKILQVSFKVEDIWAFSFKKNKRELNVYVNGFRFVVEEINGLMEKLEAFEKKISAQD